MGAQSTFNGLIIIRFYLRCFKFYSSQMLLKIEAKFVTVKLYICVRSGSGLPFLAFGNTILDQRDIVLGGDNSRG